MRALVHITKEVYAYRELLLSLTYRNIRVKYKQAAMGILWAFFMPVLAICTGLVFRVAMAVVGGHPLRLADVVGVMVKTVPWLMFASVVGGASNSLIGNIGLITKIYFPREVMPLSALLAALFDFAISVVGLTLILAVLSLVTDESVSPIVLSVSMLWVPLLLGTLLVMSAALGLALSCANLFFRDVKYIVQVVLQFGIMFSLVYFSYEEFGQWGWVLLANPVAPLLEGIRSVMISGEMDPFLLPWIGYSAAVTLVGLFAACWAFERVEYLFAEYA